MKMAPSAGKRVRQYVCFYFASNWSRNEERGFLKPITERNIAKPTQSVVKPTKPKQMRITINTAHPKGNVS